MRRTKSEAERIFKDVTAKDKQFEVVTVHRQRLVDPITKAKFVASRGRGYQSRVRARKPGDWEI